MADRNDELTVRLKRAASAEQAAEIMKESGHELSEEEAEQLWSEIQKQRGDRDLSLEELDAVSGGSDRDWLTDGCAATVEADSWCWSNDYCSAAEVTYDNNPVKFFCPKCQVHLIDTGEDRFVFSFDRFEFQNLYRCPQCGYEVWGA